MIDLFTERIEELERHRREDHERMEILESDLAALEAMLPDIYQLRRQSLKMEAADAAQLVIDLLTPMSDMSINCIYEIVRARKTLHGHEETLSKTLRK